MLDLKLLQKNPELVAESLKNRNSGLSMDEFTDLDAKRRALLSEVENLKAERNKASAEVAALKKAGADASALITQTAALGERIKALDAETAAVQEAQNSWMLNIPNIPHSSVPVGKDEKDNPEVARWGTPPAFDFKPKEHWELAGVDPNTPPGLCAGLDFERGAKLAGSRFTVLWRWAARLERAIANFFLDVQTGEHGYAEIIPPVIVNRKSMTGTGNLPKFEEDLFKLQNWEYFLIPTAEVPLTNLHADEILDEKSLPLAYAAHTSCFRSEAGSYGKDTKGLIRQHQFGKVEMVRIAHPDSSFDELEKMRSHAEALLRKLELPYRVITLCTGDMGFSSCKTYDIEVWLPGQNTYREISSCSNCGDFQARRANLRFRNAAGKLEYAHTLNGSGLPTGRTMVAILENGQRKDGSIVLPAALRPYLGGLEIIEPK